jgi:Ran-binding protein 1
MKLQPNIGSDRSWVWKAAADFAESPPTPETLAIRFANAESRLNVRNPCALNAE